METQPDSHGKRRLPQPGKFAIWHPQSGLVVSPFTRHLPSRVTKDMYSMDPDDYFNPRVLEDQDIFLAFYPRRNWDEGTLFSTLAIPNIASVIVEESSVGSTAQPRFILREDVLGAWAELENTLLDVAGCLYSEHWECRRLPSINYPIWPHQYGYRTSHESLSVASTTIRRSMRAFRLLIAYVSFVLSLWITDFEEDCFDKPFRFLSNRKHDPIPPVFLDYLRDSIVCNLSPGRRPGGFLNPYSTTWGSFFPNFCRFSVPFWLIWGHEDNYKAGRPVDKALGVRYMPPEDHINVVKARKAFFMRLALPSQQEDERSDPSPALQGPLSPPMNSAFDDPLPDFAIIDDNGAERVDGDPPPVDRTSIVDTYNTAQSPKEQWEQFRARMETGLEKRRASESERDRMSRESLEKTAREKGHTKKTTVFYWDEDEVVKGFYRRMKIDRIDVPKYWSECTEHQRFFWSHRKEWDLVPHLPRYPAGTRAETPVEDLDIEDERFNFLYGKVERMPPSKPNDDFIKNSVDQFLQSIQAATAEVETLEEYTFPFLTLSQYLKFRHGFSIGTIDNWHSELHDPNPLKKKVYLRPENSKYALLRLGYAMATRLLPATQDELKAVVDFHNVCVAVECRGTSFWQLPSSWDLSSGRHLDHRQVQVQIVKCHLPNNSKLYVLRPSRLSRDASSWFVATTSATAVLLVFRQQWESMREIATGFLELNVPFHTVEERMKEDKLVQPWKYRPRGLGLRSMHFTPTELDYLAYVKARDDVLQSPRARSIRLRGGILGRLASEVVPNVAVLDGPLFCDEVIGSTDTTFFSDDFITPHDLDVVSGVYRVEVRQGGTVTSDLSWWPKYGTCKKMGLNTDQWTPAAEDFFCKRVDSFRKKQWKLRTATNWKESYKFDRPILDLLYGGAEKLASDFLQSHLRST